MAQTLFLLIFPVVNKPLNFGFCLDNLNSEWIKIEQEYDQTINSEIEKGQKIISELEKITNKNKCRNK